MKNTNKIISAFCVVLLLLCVVSCNKATKDNDSAIKSPSNSHQAETSSGGKNNTTNNNDDTQTNSPPDNDIQYLPDDFVNNTDSDDEIESGDLEDGPQNEQDDDNLQDDKPHQNDEKIEYDNDSGWSSGWK